MELRLLWKKCAIMKILKRAGIYVLCVSIVLLSGCGNESLKEAEPSLDGKLEAASMDGSGDNRCDDLVEGSKVAAEADITVNEDADTEGTVGDEPEGTTEEADSEEWEAKAETESGTGEGADAGTGVEAETEAEIGMGTEVEEVETGMGAEIEADSKAAAEESSVSEAVCYVDAYANQAIALINAQREAAGVPPLAINTTLVSAAQIRAKELTQNFSHTRPDGSISFSAFNVSYSGAAENIAAGQWSPEWVVDSWMNSEEHRANIMDARYTQTAIACIYDPDSPYEYYWVQLFIG